MPFMPYGKPDKETQRKREIMYLRRRIELLRKKIEKGISSPEEIDKEYKDILVEFAKLGEPSEAKKDFGELQIAMESR